MAHSENYVRGGSLPPEAARELRVDVVMRMGRQSCDEYAEEDFADNAHERDASIVVTF